MWLRFGMAVASAAAPPSLVGPTGEIGAHDAVTLTFSAPANTFVDGCVPVEWERREGERWVAVPREVCPAQRPATLVEGKLTLSVPPREPGEYRALMAWGLACAPTLPMQLGACKKLDFVRSEPFRVKASD